MSALRNMVGHPPARSFDTHKALNDLRLAHSALAGKIDLPTQTIRQYLVDGAHAIMLMNDENALTDRMEKIAGRLLITA